VSFRFQAGHFGRGCLGCAPLCFQTCRFSRSRFCRETLLLPLEPLGL
jgi:hypothetical protein